MRLFILATCLLFSQTSFSDQVFFKPLGNSKITGDIMINNIGGDISYNFDNTPLKQSYAVVVYQQGTCQNYSSPIIPMATSMEGVAAPYDWKHKNALIHLTWDQFHQQLLDTPLKPGEGRNMNLRAGASSGHPITNIDFKGTVLVVEEVDSAYKPNGVGVACGVHP